MDSFSLHRLKRFVKDHRQKHGELATLADLEKAGFSKKDVSDAVEAKIIAELYVTLTTGAVVKGYKLV